MDIVKEYAEHVESTLHRIRDSQASAIGAAADIVVLTVVGGGIVYTFGSGHSSLVAIEFYHRAGGLAYFDVIQDKTFGRAERLTGYGKVLLDSYPISAKDALLLISNSGRNVAPVEMALEARERGIRTIALTSVDFSRGTVSRHSSGKRLFEVCDVVVDTCGRSGDAVLTIAGEEQRPVGPISSIAGMFLANCIVGIAAQKLTERGIDPMIFVSQNIDQKEHQDERLIEFLRTRTRGI